MRFPPLTAKAPPRRWRSRSRTCPASGAEAGVDRAHASGCADRRAAEQGQGAVGGDRVAGDGPRCGVHREEECPSWLISTQHGAVCRSGNGEAPIEYRVPFRATLKAETVPLSPVVGVGDEQLAGVGRSELAAEGS